MTEECEQQTQQHAQWVYPVMHFGGKCAEALELYKNSFGAEVSAFKGEEKKWVSHATVKMPKSNVHIMCCDDFMLMRSETKPMASRVYAYVDDVDAVCETAIKAGFKAIKSVYSPAAKPSNMFWGDRIVALIDPYGHEWVLAQPKKDESSEIVEQAKTWESNYPQILTELYGLAFLMQLARAQLDTFCA
eukprot:TRINITY_DN11073_c0_g2_i1.p2 TRINITY_DN11073_c0_g2~~TRINITY_DN11073_c0_g2_i1.p2  ORF type:complete len:189 (-),score=28.42 TRINITY_DN11073_c0_g2_i1:366-932(-)